MKKTKLALAVGQKLWRFEPNKRVYEKENGYPRLVYRHHWIENGATVVGETRVNWLVVPYDKEPPYNLFMRDIARVPKNGPLPPEYAVDAAVVEQDIWVHDNKYKLIDVIQKSRDYAALKAVAELVGYEGKK
jgi:hypothetical protein